MKEGVVVEGKRGEWVNISLMHEHRGDWVDGQASKGMIR